MASEELKGGTPADSQRLLARASEGVADRPSRLEGRRIEESVGLDDFRVGRGSWVL